MKKFVVYISDGTAVDIKATRWEKNNDCIAFYDNAGMNEIGLPIALFITANIKGFVEVTN